MKATIELREKTGLTQEQIAEYLSITRSHLSLYELDKRDLPTSAIMRLTELELVVNKASSEKKVVAHIKRQQQKAQQLLEKHAKQQQYKQSLAQRKLETIQKTYSQKMNLLQVLTHLKGVNKGIAKTERHNAWLNMMETVVLDEIEHSGLHKQALLKLQIAGFNQQQEHVKQLKKEILH